MLKITGAITAASIITGCSITEPTATLLDEERGLDIGELLFGENPTHDLYKSKGPRWKEEMIEKNWDKEESITKAYDESETVYDAVLSCQEDRGKTTEGFDSSDAEYELHYAEIQAVKNIKAMEAYRSGERRSAPKSVAYVLVPSVTITYSTDDTPNGVCVVVEEEQGFVYANDARKMEYLGRIVYGEFEPKNQ